MCCSIFCMDSFKGCEKSTVTFCLYPQSSHEVITYHIQYYTVMHVYLSTEALT